MNGTATLILGLALIFTMWGMGLTLVIDDFKRVFEKPKAIFLGLINQLIFLPLIAFGLLKLLPTNPEVAVGIMILAACPGGPTSNLLSLLAKADTALSVSLTAVTSVITVFSIPIIVNIGLENFAGDGKDIQLDTVKTIGTMIIVVIIPMIAGMVIKNRVPDFAAKMEKPVRVISVILLALIIVGIVIKERAHILDYFAQAGILALLLNSITMLFGFGTSRLLKLSGKQAVTISLESGIQNGTMALMIAGTLLANVSYGIAPAVYSLIMYFTGGFLVNLFLKNKI
ncbi:MAG: bile acid:sodium symporter family protein [Bacteroidia bacterium]|nr:bile acid:sodium symporter family protein [Bacteroidia bacterium]NNJ54986.1 bile acid:sodium symporter family protein [Bacteroidia bacterium]